MSNLKSFSLSAVPALLPWLYRYAWKVLIIFMLPRSKDTTEEEIVGFFCFVLLPDFKSH